MSKQGMARPDYTHIKSKNDLPPVPEIQGKAKHGKEKAKPIVSGTYGPEMKVHHGNRASSKAYPVMDNDLAWDNMDNNIPFADREDI